MSQVWLITDAARGLGRTLAEAVLRAGRRVIAGARDPGRLAALAARHATHMRAVGVDLADEASIYAAVDEALTAFGRIDVVVGLDGGADAAADVEMDDAALRAQLETDFFGSAALAHAVLPVLREQRGGRFVQILADHAADSAARRAAQAALRSYLEALAATAARDGVDIDVVDPGAMLAQTIGRNASSARVLRFAARPEAA